MQSLLPAVTGPVALAQASGAAAAAGCGEAPGTAVSGQRCRLTEAMPIRIMVPFSHNLYTELTNSTEEFHLCRQHPLGLFDRLSTRRHFFSWQLERVNVLHRDLWYFI